MTELLKEYEDYLDRVALKTMEVLLMRKPLNGIVDSIDVATIAYKQALAMLDVKQNLEGISRRNALFIKAKREEKFKQVNADEEKRGRK